LIFENVILLKIRIMKGVYEFVILLGLQSYLTDPIDDVNL